MNYAEKIVDKFDQDFSENYERKVRATVPGYEITHAMVRSILGSILSNKADVLILGSGTGMEFVTLGKDQQGWRFTGVDPSPDMLAIANARVNKQGLGDRVNLVKGFVSDLPEKKQFDAAVSVLVMHFLPDDGAKLAFLKATAARLRPGAPLILVDMHGDKSTPAFEQLYQSWKCYLESLGYDHSSLDKELELVHFVQEERIVSLMEQAGFNSISRFHQAYLFGGWFGRRL
ncbi:MAG: class I SAM-dependent methyltransferase [Pseudomonadota bacterium]